MARARSRILQWYLAKYRWFSRNFPIFELLFDHQKWPLTDPLRSRLYPKSPLDASHPLPGEFWCPVLQNFAERKSKSPIPQKYWNIKRRPLKSDSDWVGGKHETKYDVNYKSYGDNSMYVGKLRVQRIEWRTSEHFLTHNGCNGVTWRSIICQHRRNFYTSDPLKMTIFHFSGK